MFYNKGSYENNSEYDFATTSVNESKQVTFSIKNNGTIPLKMSDIKLINNSQNYYQIVSTPSKNELLPSEKESITIQYSPKTVEKKEHARLSIKTNDNVCKEFVLNLKGYPIKPELQLYQIKSKIGVPNNSLQDYGTLYNQKFVEVDYTFRNLGSAVLNISDFNVECPKYGRVEISRVVNENLSNTQSSHFKIKYYCLNPGKNSFDISFKTNDYNCKLFEFKAKIFAEIPVLKIENNGLIENKSELDLKDKAFSILEIKNEGNTGLYIQKIYLDGEQSKEFKVENFKGYINAGETKKLKLETKSTLNQNLSAKLLIESNDYIHPLFTINLKASPVKITSVNYLNNTICKIYYQYNKLQLHHNLSLPVIYTIYDLNGNLLQANNINTTKHEINQSLKKGIYLLNLKNRLKNYTTKIVIR